MVLDAEKSNINILPDLVLGEISLLGLQMTDFSLCPHMVFSSVHVHMVERVGGRGRENSFFYPEGPTSRPNLITSQRPYLQKLMMVLNI